MLVVTNHRVVVRLLNANSSSGARRSKKGEIGACLPTDAGSKTAFHGKVNDPINLVASVA
jgi:hypothetical protein